MTGTQLDHYRILEKLGEGGMGVVYKAVDLNLDRIVALKLLSSDLATYPELTERFKCEARLQATLSHPNIALLYTFFFWEGSPVMVMEFIEGETFQHIVRERGPVSPAALVPLFKQALMGVGAAHRHGIVHRDIKPANIMLSHKGLVKVMDFGIAKAVGGAGTGLTRTNTAIGTSWYMSPEQVLNQPVDARSDIYSLGITLYEMLSGEVPFRGNSEFEIQRAHVHAAPSPPSAHNPRIPAHLVAAVMRALEKNPDARFQSVEEFSSALGSIAPPVAIETPPVRKEVTPVPPSRAPEIPKTPPPGPVTPPPAAPLSAKANVAPRPARRRSFTPIVLAGIVMAALALGGFLYAYAASQQRERAREEAILEEQEAERQRQATEERERAKQQEAQDQRDEEALKERIRQEEGTGNGGQAPAPPSSNTTKPARGDDQDDQGSALSRALGNATQPPVARAPASPSEPATPAGLWKGTYMCIQQGQNQAEISIFAKPGGTLTALMAFQVPNSRPGTYLMRGIFDQSTGQIKLYFTRWLNHPVNYVPANLTAVVDLRQGVMRGQVIAPGCGNFEVWRTR